VVVFVAICVVAGFDDEFALAVIVDPDAATIVVPCSALDAVAL
jgi:hypothetical protein